ncbi:MAG: hypothetical protein ACR2PT_24390 [Endozoicomonas sp.]
MQSVALITLVLLLSVPILAVGDITLYRLAYFEMNEQGLYTQSSTIDVTETFTHSEKADTSQLNVSYTPSSNPASLSPAALANITNNELVIKRARNYDSQAQEPSAFPCVRKYQPKGLKNVVKKPGERVLPGAGAIQSIRLATRRASMINTEVVAITLPGNVELVAYPENMQQISVSLPTPQCRLWEFIRHHLSETSVSVPSTEASPAQLSVNWQRRKLTSQAQIDLFRIPFSSQFVDFVFGLDCRHQIIALMNRRASIFALLISAENQPDGLLLLEGPSELEQKTGLEDSFQALQVNDQFFSKPDNDSAPTITQQKTENKKNNLDTRNEALNGSDPTWDRSSSQFMKLFLKTGDEESLPLYFFPTWLYAQ